MWPKAVISGSSHYLISRLFLEHAAHWVVIRDTSQYPIPQDRVTIHICHYMQHHFSSCQWYPSNLVSRKFSQLALYQSHGWVSHPWSNTHNPRPGLIPCSRSPCDFFRVKQLKIIFYLRKIYNYPSGHIFTAKTKEKNTYVAQFLYCYRLLVHHNTKATSYHIH